jgi:putative NADPH-quinone reductase
MSGGRSAVPRKIVIIQGHPDPAGGHLCHALADAYAEGAREGGHEIEQINIAGLDFAPLRTKEEFEKAGVPPGLADCQEKMSGAGHWLIVHPLWLGSMPALTKAFLEHMLRPGFAFRLSDSGRGSAKLLKGRSARIVITMGMPVLVYRWWFGAHGLKSLERSVLGFVGIGPIRESLFGMVEVASNAKRAAWLARMRSFGRAGA